MSAKSSSKSINFLSLLLGILLVIIRSITVSIHKSPYDMIHKLDQNGIIPPVWIINLCLSILFFSLGYAAGIIICECSSGKGHNNAVYAYKGGMYFAITIFTLTAHYSLFFIFEKLLISLITAIITVTSSIICAFAWGRISTPPTLIMSVCAVFSSYLALINLLIMIIN